MASAVSSKVVISVPSTYTCPSVGVSTPPRICSRVLLPEPDGPMMATNCPFGTVKDTSSSARTSVSPLP